MSTLGTSAFPQWPVPAQTISISLWNSSGTTCVFLTSLKILMVVHISGLHYISVIGAVSVPNRKLVVSQVAQILEVVVRCNFLAFAISPSLYCTQGYCAAN